MEQSAWITKNCPSLKHKTAALTGATGDLGQALCRGILTLGGSLLLLDRDPEKDQRLKKQLLLEFPGACIDSIPLDLTDLGSVDRAVEALQRKKPDLLIHNAGVYMVPRFSCSTGLDNIFQTNFAAPYYLTRRLLPTLSQAGGKVLVMGSLAHNYRRSDPADPALSENPHCSLVYGNTKRYLMFAFAELLKGWPQVDFAIAHPGVSFTHMSNHYPGWLYPLLRPFLKALLLPPETAVRGMLLALGTEVPQGFWIGPPVLNTWGNPARKPLKTCSAQEQRTIYETAERIYGRMTKEFV